MKTKKENTPKYKVGDKLRDTFSNKVGLVTKFYLGESPDPGRGCPAYYYSIDPMGWYYIPEYELEYFKEE